MSPIGHRAQDIPTHTRLLGHGLQLAYTRMIQPHNRDNMPERLPQSNGEPTERLLTRSTMVHANDTRGCTDTAPYWTMCCNAHARRAGPWSHWWLSSGKLAVATAVVHGGRSYLAKAVRDGSVPNDTPLQSILLSSSSSLHTSSRDADSSFTGHSLSRISGTC